MDYYETLIVDQKIYLNISIFQDGIAFVISLLLSRVQCWETAARRHILCGSSS